MRLRGEKDDRLAEMADEFFASLRRAVNNNEHHYSRLLSLWHCYYDPQGPSQLEIAELLGVSDSLVSNNHRLIEHELKKLKLTVEDSAVLGVLAAPGGSIARRVKLHSDERLAL